MCVCVCACMYACACVCAFSPLLCSNPCWCAHYVLATVKLQIIFSVLMYIMCVTRLLRALICWVGALQISIIIIIFTRVAGGLDSGSLYLQPSYTRDWFLCIDLLNYLSFSFHPKQADTQSATLRLNWWWWGWEGGGGGGGGEELVPKLKFAPITSWSQADCNYLDILMLGQETKEPGASGWWRVLPCHQQTNQHACYFIICQVATAPETINWENTIIIYTKLREYNNYIQCHSCCFIIWQGFNFSK